MRAVRSLAAVFLVLAFPGFAHDLQTSIRQQGSFVVLEASYEGDEAASFLAVSVHAPSAGDNASADAFQTGRTDLRGRFLFQPDRGGEWRITLDDELGHRVTTTIAVETDAAPGVASTESVSASTARPTSERLTIGLSLIIGITGLLYGWLSRRKLRHRIS